MADGGQFSTSGSALALAWAGWQMRVPSDWRPLSVSGGAAQGAMMLGDASRPLMRIKWARPSGRRFDAERWIRRRVRSAAGKHAGVEPTDASPDFRPGAFARAAGGRKTRRRLWYGYAPRAGIALELVISAEAGGGRPVRMDRGMLASLRASGPDEPTCWAVFDASFVAPPPFVYRASRLHLGDIALCLTAGGGRRLLMRQVYPAKLALSRRELARWLQYPPFKEHRKVRPAGEPERWTVQSFGRALEGLLRKCPKRLPAPLGACGPRWSVSGVLVDDRMDRLLLVEHDVPPATAAASEIAGAAGPGGGSEALAEEVIGRMNWARLEKEPRP